MKNKLNVKKIENSNMNNYNRIIKMAKGKRGSPRFDRKLDINTNFINNEKNLTFQSNMPNDFNNIYNDIMKYKANNNSNLNSNLDSNEYNINSDRPNTQYPEHNKNINPSYINNIPKANPAQYNRNIQNYTGRININKMHRSPLNENKNTPIEFNAGMQYNNTNRVNNVNDIYKMQFGGGNNQMYSYRNSQNY
jgi:hypothetical protein